MAKAAGLSWHCFTNTHGVYIVREILVEVTLERKKYTTCARKSEPSTRKKSETADDKSSERAGENVAMGIVAIGSQVVLIYRRNIGLEIACIMLASKREIRH